MKEHSTPTEIISSQEVLTQPFVMLELGALGQKLFGDEQRALLAQALNTELFLQVGEPADYVQQALDSLIRQGIMDAWERAQYPNIPRLRKTGKTSFQIGRDVGSYDNQKAVVYSVSEPNGEQFTHRLMFIYESDSNHVSYLTDNLNKIGQLSCPESLTTEILVS